MTSFSITSTPSNRHFLSTEKAEIDTFEMMNPYHVIRLFFMDGFQEIMMTYQLIFWITIRKNIQQPKNINADATQGFKSLLPIVNLNQLLNRQKGGA